MVAVVGFNGALLQENRYDPYGNLLSSTSAIRNPLLYTGRELDRETGLYYYRARYYDPDVGRFLTEDPLGFEAGLNFYAYIDNNPVNFTDPMGLQRRGGPRRIRPGQSLLEIYHGPVLREPPPSTPVGRSGQREPITYPRNTPTTISGREYSGHALDRIQWRGTVPSVVEHTIQSGESGGASI